MSEIKNLENMYGLIADPLRQEFSGGEGYLCLLSDNYYIRMMFGPAGRNQNKLGRYEFDIKNFLKERRLDDDVLGFVPLTEFARRVIIEDSHMQPKIHNKMGSMNFDVYI